MDPALHGTLQSRQARGDSLVCGVELGSGQLDERHFKLGAVACSVSHALISAREHVHIVNYVRKRQIIAACLRLLKFLVGHHKDVARTAQ